MTDSFQDASPEQLAQSAQGGDWAAFEALVSRFERRIYGFMFQCCRHHADARELTQETFVTAYQHLADFDVTQSFTTWLFTIARRKWIDCNRRQWRETGVNEIPEMPDLNDPATLMARREAAEELWQSARQLLSDTQFQALWLHYAEDLAVCDVARVIRRTPTHVKVLLFRARRILARRWAGRLLTARLDPGNDRADRLTQKLGAPGRAAPIISRSL